MAWFISGSLNSVASRVSNVVENGLFYEEIYGVKKTAPLVVPLVEFNVESAL